jgi:hypothetical protein
MFNKSAVLCAVLTLVVVVTPYIALADTASSTASVATTTPTTATTRPALDPYSSTDVEAAVRAYFADVPVMANIAKCESNFREYDSAGNVLNGGSGGMIGVFQINRSVHKAFALTLGDNINTLAGNMAYARYLYSNEGTTPWDSSKFCWGSVAVPAAASSSVAVSIAVTPTSTPSRGPDQSVGVVNTNLRLGTVSPQVVALQKLLNGAGYKVAKSGAGSPGQETTKFGSATKAAVQRFQCAQNIACKGSEATTGYGLVGAKTRAALLQAAAALAKA